MTKEIIIIALILALVFLYQQNRKLQQSPSADNSFEWERPRLRKTALIFDRDDEWDKKHETLIAEHKRQAQEWKTKEQDYLQQIKELKENKEDSEESEEIIAERDAAIREKNEAGQEVLSLSNKLKNKQQEISRKETEIERLKKEKSQSEISLNKKITEKNGLITTLQREVNQSKEKYSKQGKLLDEEQLECKKLEEKIEKLEQQITELKRSKSPMTGEFPEEELGKSIPKERKNNDSIPQFKEWLAQDEEQEKLFAKVDWNYYEKKENWIKEFQNWNRLQPQRIKILENWLKENNHD